MTKLEVMQENKKYWERVKKALPMMDNLEMLVAQNLVYKWCSGHKWQGGISDRDYMNGSKLILKSNGGRRKYTQNEFDLVFHMLIDGDQLNRVFGK